MPTDSIPTPLESQRHRCARARVGSTLSEKWRLDELLGVGGMAAVYGATHRNGRRAALKILHPTLSEVQELRDRFFDEAYAANLVNHPGTVAVLDDGVCPDGSLYLVMELLDGENLDARLTRADRGLPPAEVLALTRPLLEVLAAAHERGILHRDVKPENVFLTTSGEVKLLDFGVARMSDSLRTSRTRAGLTLGTPSFMPPEQARGRCAELDVRADVWAVGATMFTLLTGRFVHEAETQNEALLAAMSHPAPPLRSVAPHVPERVAAVVDRALAFAREERFRDARRMLRAVRAAERTLAKLEGGLPPRPRAGEPIAPPRFAPIEEPSSEIHRRVTLAEGGAAPPPRRAPDGTAGSPKAWGRWSTAPRRSAAAGALGVLAVSLVGAGSVPSVAGLSAALLEPSHGAASPAQGAAADVGAPVRTSTTHVEPTRNGAASPGDSGAPTPSTLDGAAPTTPSTRGHAAARPTRSETRAPAGGAPARFDCAPVAARGEAAQATRSARASGPPPKRRASAHPTPRSPRATSLPRRDPLARRK